MTFNVIITRKKTLIFAQRNRMLWHHAKCHPVALVKHFHIVTFHRNILFENLN